MTPGPLGIEDTSPTASAPAPIAVRASSRLLMQHILTLTGANSHATCSALSNLYLPRSPSQHRPRRRGFVPSNFHRQHDEIIVPGRDFLARQPLDDRNSLAEKNSVGHRRGCAELLGGDVVYSHKLDAGVGQQLR